MVATDEAYAAAVARALAAGRAAWPAIALDDAAFAAGVAAVVAERSAGAVEPLHAADLYLAVACARGDAAAVGAFERAHASVIERAVSAVGATPAEAGELVQIVTVRLLTARPTGGPAIATYSGRAPLARWVKVVATREAARLLAHDRREELVEDDVLASRIGGGADPQLDYLKRTYRDAFRGALAEAVDALDARERLVLRQHAIDGLGIDDLAALHAVHRATAARWVKAARQSVITATRRVLAARLAVTAAELDSILRLIHSELDISLPAALTHAGTAT